MFAFFMIKDFPGSSVSKESACSAGDPTWILRSERSPGEDLDTELPRAFLRASLVAQMVKNPPEMWETRV